MRAIEPLPGTYALVLSCASRAVIRVGALGGLRLRPGLYVYVGSALGPGGVRARVEHHARIAARPHWHIDYLRPHTRLKKVWYGYGAQRREHAWAAAIARARGAGAPLAGFGASDCGCESHLFFFAARRLPPEVRECLLEVTDLLQFGLVE